MRLLELRLKSAFGGLKSRPNAFFGLRIEGKGFVLNKPLDARRMQKRGFMGVRRRKLSEPHEYKAKRVFGGF